MHAPYIADHPSVAFVDEEYGEDRVDGKFVSNGFKNGAHQNEFKLNLEDQYGEPLDAYHHVGTLDVVPYRNTPGPSLMEGVPMEGVESFQVDLSPGRTAGSRTLRSNTKKQRAH